MFRLSRAGLIVIVVGASASAAASQDAPTSTPASTPASVKPATAASNQPPDWAQSAVWYVIDVPRFHNGDRANDPDGTLPWTPDWPARAEGDAGEKLDARLYGGDLQGVAARLPYLNDLGVNTLHLTGVFTERRGAFHVNGSVAVSGKTGNDSGGETEDVWQFDTADRVLLAFIEKAHEHSMRVVLTAHASFGSPDQAVSFMMASRRWMDPDGDGDPKDGVDGWVVVNPEADTRSLWKQWRERAKKLNPEILLVVNTAEDPAPWLKGDTFDVAVGYEPGAAIAEFFTSAAKPGTLRRLADRLSAGAKQAGTARAHASPVPLSTDRRGRLISTVMESTPAGDDKKKSNDASARWRLATILQYFVPGVPMIRYGDEVGLPGGAGASARAPMWWPDLSDAGSAPKRYRGDFASIVRWLNFRSGLLDPLRDGRFQISDVDEKSGLLVVSRILPGDEVYLVLNTSEKKQQVKLRAGRPGQLVGMISPHLVPADRRGRPLPPKPPTLDIYPLREGGNRQFVAGDGTIPLWVDAKSVRIVLVRDEEPRRAP